MRRSRPVPGLGLGALAMLVTRPAPAPVTRTLSWRSQRLDPGSTLAIISALLSIWLPQMGLRFYTWKTRSYL